MALIAECDGCHKDGEPSRIKDWRSLTVELGPPPIGEFGKVDRIGLFLLCPECADLLDFQRVRLGVATLVSRS